MRTINKEVLLDTLENKVDSQLNEVIRNYQNLGEGTLLKPAVDGGWSIAQCLEHLNTYGRFYLPRIKAGMDNQHKDSSTNDFRSTWLGQYFTNLMQPGKGMKKMKTFKAHVPVKDLNVHAVIAEFIEQQETLLLHLKKARHKDLHSIKISVSISQFIRLKLGDVLQFIIAHNERHLQQAKRNL